jgi:transketolase
VETAHPEYWRKYVGLAGKVIGISTFGESAPGAVLLEHFGFTEKHIVGTVKELLVK